MDNDALDSDIAEALPEVLESPDGAALVMRIYHRLCDVDPQMEQRAIKNFANNAPPDSGTVVNVVEALKRRVIAERAQARQAGALKALDAALPPAALKPPLLKNDQT